MKLSELAHTPKLIKILLDEEELVKKYGESIEFWIYDRQDINTYMKLASIEEGNFSNISAIIQDLILDEDGSQMLDENQQLPMDVMIKMVEKTVQYLGNLASQTSET